MASWLIRSHGLSVIGRNVAVGRSEVDLIALDGRERVVLEVRSTTGPGDPIDAVDDRKRRHVGALARASGADRVDFVGVGFGTEAVYVHWLPGRSRTHP